MKIKNFFLMTLILMLLNIKPIKNADFIEKENIVNYLDTSNIYLAFKGTSTKPGKIAKKYNLYNKKASHVGILYYDIDEWKIIHVTNVKKNSNNLYIEKIDEYYRSTKEVNYESIFEIQNINKDSVLVEIKKNENKLIEFDNDFDLQNKNFYCSEFVVSILGLNRSLKPTKITITNFQHKIFLGRDTLIYYPVDLFYNHANFKKIYEKDYSI